MSTKMITIEREDGHEFVVPTSYRFVVCPCRCPANCGSVNLILENDEGEPIAAAQFSWQQVLESFVDAAIEAREKQGLTSPGAKLS